MWDFYAPSEAMVTAAMKPERGTMKSKLNVTAAAVLSVLVLTVGCGASNADNGSDSEPTGSSDTASEGGDEGGAVEQTTLTIESYRTEDASAWTDKILPAFHDAHPEIHVEFKPTFADDFDATLNARFQGGTAGDIITCRSGSRNLATIAQGYLEPIDGLPGLDNFSDLSIGFFGSPEGDPYCVPVASVMAGFFYNKTIFDELDLAVPTTVDEFHAVLSAIEDDGQYDPIIYGTGTPWSLDYMGIYNIGPNFWHGEDGRQGIIDGSKKFTDPEFVAGLTEFASWTQYLPAGYESLEYTDAQQLFALGKAAIFPSGSWDIPAVTANGIDVGVFAPPLPNAGDQLYVQSHPDHGIGINAASEHKDAARKFLEWIATPEFSAMYADSLPGFFPLLEGPVTLEDPLAQEWSDMKIGAELTPRIGQFQLSEGSPAFESEMQRMSPDLVTGKISPADLAAEIQAGLESWYEPQQR